MYLKPFPSSPKQVRGRNSAVLEEKLSRVLHVISHFVQFPAAMKSRSVLIYQDEADPPVSGIWIGLDSQNNQVREVAIGYKGLLSIDYIGIPVFHSSRANG